MIIVEFPGLVHGNRRVVECTFNKFDGSTVAGRVLQRLRGTNGTGSTSVPAARLRWGSLGEEMILYGRSKGIFISHHDALNISWGCSL
jgi:hypothetical protein